MTSGPKGKKHLDTAEHSVTEASLHWPLILVMRTSLGIMRAAKIEWISDFPSRDHPLTLQHVQVTLGPKRRSMSSSSFLCAKMGWPWNMWPWCHANFRTFIRIALWTYTTFRKLPTKLVATHQTTSRKTQENKNMKFHQIQVSISSQVDVDCPIRRWYVWNPADHEANLPTPQVVTGIGGG